MKKINRKGFTLIELLAVIIILAVIALIATPIVLNVVDNAKKSANLQTVNGIIDAGRLYYAESMLDESKKGKIENVIDIYPDVTLSNKPDNAKLYVNGNGLIATSVVLDKTCYIKTFDKELEVKEDISSCDLGNISKDNIKPTIEFSYNGEKGNNDWYVSDTYITAKVIDNESGPSKLKWCMTDSEDCEPTTEINQIQVSPIIDTDTTGKRICVIGYDVFGNESEIKCSDLIKVDKTAPILTAKLESFEITEGDNVNTRTYFNNPIYSISGEGSMHCNPSNTSGLAVGQQTITCTVTGNNGLSSSVDKSISVKSKNQLLTTLLKQQYSSANTTGLLKDGDNYYYKGTNAQAANNFVWFEGHLWRVIQVNNDNTVTMITQQPLTAISPTYNVWNSQSTYESSYINDWLNRVFYNSISDKSKIQKHTFNVGIYTNVSEMTTTQYAGLLDESQYIRAGATDSFLDIKDMFWLGNRHNNNGIRAIHNTGQISYGDPPISNGVRPVIRISDLTIANGNGTLIDPFREANKSTNTNDIKVGEYISVPTSGTSCGSDKRCLFRVVQKDNDTIKVILNGLLPITSQFDNNSRILFSSYCSIYNPLIEFAKNISSEYYYSGEKIFNIGTYQYISEFPYGTDYKLVSNTTTLSSVGLPTVGEMFSGNDIDVTLGSKVFVNESTVENPKIMNSFWTMNSYISSSMRLIAEYGNLTNGYPDGNPGNRYGVRPVLFLNKGSNSDLTFTKGDGTAENPYWLGN